MIIKITPKTLPVVFFTYINRITATTIHTTKPNNNVIDSARMVEIYIV